jgi:DNA-binding transcriptional LysR family regulator
MNDFSNRQLRCFVAVAEELHFGRAAQRLHVSQSALSQRIVILEDEIGVQLLIRTKRKVELTPAGEQFLNDSRLILSDMAKAAVRAKATAEGQTGVLRIGLNYSSPFHPVVTKTFTHFAKHYPNVRLEFRQDRSAKQLDALHQHTLDLCFIWPTRDDLLSNVTIWRLDEDELQLVVAREDALARKPHITISDLRKQTIFLTPWQTRTNFYNGLVAACHKAGFEIDPQIDITQMPFIMNVVAASQGIAFIPEFLNRTRPLETVFRPFGFLPSPLRTLPLCLAYRTKDSSPFVQNFIAAAKSIRPGMRKN